MRKYMDFLWNVLITIVVYCILSVLFYQVIFNYELLQTSFVISTFATIIIRFLMTKVIEELVDFNIYREIGVLIITYLLSYLIFIY